MDGGVPYRYYTLLFIIFRQRFSKWSQREQHHLGARYNCLFSGSTPDLTESEIGEWDLANCVWTSPPGILTVLKCENHCSRAVVFTVCSMDCCYQNQVGLVKQHFCLRVLDTDLSPMLSVIGLLFGTVLERIISLVLSPWGIDIFLVFQLPHILVFFFLGLCLLLFRY